MRPDSEAGFSLAEILITIVIVAVTFTAILGGLMTSITVSALHRKQPTADTLARDAAEWVKDSRKNPYVNCAGTGTYTFTGLTIPSGYAVSVTSVKYWDGNTSVNLTSTTGFTATCPPIGFPADQGLQYIKVVANSTDGSASESVEVFKRTVP